ncbi:probable LRR receptor-like serine/threonine-protein kinase At1g67720 isoform X2 [Macadamia integrifolia]|uniref:probable LRR receptor-like serine/threonine-protein kinase At1g67720 isoform X2 n=1 Tax=Macadamia integrifolia TaxID=60698 RepID=UPI001C4E3510|nr:probable LRR receptor-like serine/threonine-protein kinase At1g67720 isoform X2 [Macadamia integrifolia]
MALSSHLLVLLLHLIPLVICQVTEFVSIDCGGTNNYTDPSTGLAWVSDTGFIRHGQSVDIKNPNGDSSQYRRRRDFPADRNKYCYTLSTTQRRRYLVRATFQYGNSDSGDPYPKFQLYLDATMWSTITVLDASRVYVEEMIIRATSTSIDVCLCCASTGSPFISTLELRPLNLSMYATDYEDCFYLAVAARVNFGAPSNDPIRYPDDPYDRIWESDLDRRPNFLVGVAPGTERISTSKNINVGTREFPPLKVMQTAVIGTQGRLSYRLTLDGFPANARGYAYFAEIEDLGKNDTRKFRLEQPQVPGYNNAIVNIDEDAHGSYTLYEPSDMNASLDFVLSFSFVKTWDSTRGPLLNAIEISKYVQIIPKTESNDAMTLDTFRSMCPGSDCNDEEGDPCIPNQWEWVTCSSSSPPRITKLALSGKHLKGKIPDELKHLDGLTELWLDGNSLSGSIPDISNLLNLTIVHLENNRLTGPIPSYFGDFPSLRELYIQNNSLNGEIPPSLLTGKLVFNYDGNSELFQGEHKKNFKLILGTSIGVVFLVFILGSLLLLHNLRRKPSQEKSNDKCNSLCTTSKPSAAHSLVHGGSLMDEGPDVAYYITLSDLEEATQKFSRRIGKGSFGPVYYGKMKDGKEVAVKILDNATSHGNQQFVNEVALLSRIHHRNLVPLIGYCEEAHQSILVYEYMHNGSLQDHIHEALGLAFPSFCCRGCSESPIIIHRDVKTSNILLDINMRAKVSDFGLSRQADENLTHVSSVVCGTFGYLDPEYYANQQLTEKSDVYSFGVVLLELISGRKPVSVEEYGPEWHIVHWARSLIRKGDVMSILDPSLAGNIKIESLWRIAEVAILSIEPHGSCRPKMQEIVLAIQDAIRIEKGKQKNYTTRSCFRTGQSPHISLPSASLEIDKSDFSSGCIAPSAR